MKRTWKQTLLMTVAALALLWSLAGVARAGIHPCEWHFGSGFYGNPIFASDKHDGAAEFYSIDYGYFSGKSADELLDNHMLVKPRHRPDGSDQGCDLREAIEAIAENPNVGALRMLHWTREKDFKANVILFQAHMTPFNVFYGSEEEEREKMDDIRRGLVDIIAGERYHQLGNGSRKHHIDETLTLTFDGDREDQLYPNGQTIILSGAIPLATHWNAGAELKGRVNNEPGWEANLLLDFLEGEAFEEKHWTEERGMETILDPRDYDYKAKLVVDVGDGNSAFVLEGKGTLVLRDIEIELKSGRLFENRGDVKVVLSRVFIDVDTAHDPKDAILVHRFDADSESWNDEWWRPSKRLVSRMSFWEERNPLVLRRMEGYYDEFEPQLDEGIEPSTIRLRGEAPLFADETDDVVPLFMGPHDLEWLQFDRPNGTPPPERAATRATTAPIACDQRFPDGCVLREGVTTVLRLRSGDIVKPLHHMGLIGCAPDSSIWGGIEYRRMEDGEHIAVLKLGDYDPETDRLVDGYGTPIAVMTPTCPDGTPMNISGTGEACPIDNGRVGDDGAVECDGGYVEEVGRCVEKRCPEGMEFDLDAADAHEPYCSLEHEYEWDVDGNAVWPECPGETVPDGIDTPALVDPDDRFGGWTHCICPDRSEPVLSRGRLRCDIDPPADDPAMRSGDGETPPERNDDPPANEPPADDDDDDDGDDGADLNSSSDANDGCNPLTGRCDDDADDPTEDPTFSATGDADAFVSGCTLTAGGAGDARGILLILLMGIVALTLMRPRRKAA